MSTAHWRVREVVGTLPGRNATISEAKASGLVVGPTTELEIPNAVFSPFYEKALQGATLVPRPFWFIEPMGPGTSDWVPVTTTDAQTRQAKDGWRGIRLEGRIERRFLYCTVLEVGNFRTGAASLCALPVRHAAGKPELLREDEVVAAGAPYFGAWLREAETLWRRHKKHSRAHDVRVTEYLDNHRNLSRQRLDDAPRLIYSGKGSHLRATVLDPAPLKKTLPLEAVAFVLDQNHYEIRCSQNEGHYLAAILNTDYANAAIKLTQTTGDFGARDIHRRPFEVLPIPAFDSKRPTHQELVSLSVAAHARVAGTRPPKRRALQLAPVRDLVDRAEVLAREVVGVDFYETS